jgi:hypothetical protein
MNVLCPQLVKPIDEGLPECRVRHLTEYHGGHGLVLHQRLPYLVDKGRAVNHDAPATECSKHGVLLEGPGQAGYTHNGQISAGMQKRAETVT